ncbi:MAG: hypothetical protein ACO4AU_07025 [bacterium]|jgi:hypothetical protein
MKATLLGVALLGALPLWATEYYCQAEFFLGFNSREDGTATTYRLLSDSRYVLRIEQERLAVFRPNDEADFCDTSFYDWEAEIHQCLRRNGAQTMIERYFSFNPKNLKFSVITLEKVGFETIHGGLCRKTEDS